MKTLLERLELKINNTHAEMVEMLEEEAIEDITEFIEEMELTGLYNNYRFIQKILVNDDGIETKLTDKIIRIISAKNTILKDKDIKVALYTLKR